MQMRLNGKLLKTNKEDEIFSVFSFITKRRRLLKDSPV